MSTTARLSVLLVEDQPTDAALVKGLLGAVPVGNGAFQKPQLNWVKTIAEVRALATTAGSAAADVILLDLNLPDSSGLETVVTVRKWFATTPIVVLTSDSSLDCTGQALEAGAQDFLVKGQFNARDLARALRHAVVRARLEARLHLQQTALEAINALQASFIAGRKLTESFSEMLEICLALTESAFGFIGEIEHHENGDPYLHLHALSDIAWDDATRQLYSRLESGGMQLTRLKSLFGVTLTTGEAVISNQPASDPRSGGLPPGHPRLESFAGLPIYWGGEMVAMLGLANRRSGFDTGMVEFLAPLLSACGSVVASHRAHQSLRTNQSRLATLLASIPDTVLIIASDRSIVDYHTPDPTLLTAPVNRVSAQDYREVLPVTLIRPMEEAFELIRNSGENQSFESALTLASGARHVHVTLNKLLGSGALPEGFVVVIRDDTQRVQSESRLRIAATAFEAQESMIITDAECTVRSVNLAFTRATGHAADEVVGKPFALLNRRFHDAEFIQAMWECARQFGVWQGEIQAARLGDEVFPAWLSITAVSNQQGLVTDFVCAFSDITDRKLAEERIRYLAYYDMLTHLPNRRLLMDRLRQALGTRRHSGKEGALFFIDLDHFKNLNDTLGHATGDLLLREVAVRISECVRDSDTVARIGGDEFVVMLENLGDQFDEVQARAEGIAHKIMTRLSQPYSLVHHQYHITSSIGVTLFSDLSDTVDELLKRADLAMYQAKSAGRNTVRFFNPAMQVSIETRSLLEADLRQAIVSAEFTLHYQPQIDRSGRVIGAEALLRWHHPMRGSIPPDSFIPLAEDTGMILGLGQWVLRTACVQLRRWSESGETAQLSVSVNVSVRQFRHPDFVEQVHTILNETGAPAQKLKLELTESLLLDDLESAVATMSALRQIGVSFSLDDFGTGYSSLAYLKRLPLEQLKIDKSFVRDILTDPNDEVISRTIIALGHSLGLSVIAEGVETVEQCTVLLEQGCNAFQGYLFGRPATAVEFDPRTRELLPP